MKGLLSRINEARKKDKARFNNPTFFLYLIEEVGEVSSCLANAEGIKNKKLKESAREEMCDVLITAIAMYFQVGGDEKHLEEYMEKKLQRWEKRLQNVS